MWEPDGSTVMSNDVRNLLLANFLLGNFAELELSLLGVNSVRLESSLGIEKNSEVFISLFNRNNVHLTKWVSVVSSNLAIDLDETLLVLDDLSSLLSAESVLESLLQKNVDWNALSELVWTWRWSSSVHTLELSKVPLLWSGDSLYNLSLSFVSLHKDD